MAIEHIILSDTPNGLKTQSVSVLVRDGVNVRRGELVLPLESDLTALTTEQVQHVWQTGTVEPLGLRMWAAAQQRSVNDLLDRTMFAVVGAMQADTNLATLLGAAVTTLSEDPVQLAYYNKIAAYFNAADVDTRNKFLAAVIVVAIGKLGQ